MMDSLGLSASPERRYSQSTPRCQRHAGGFVDFLSCHEREAKCPIRRPSYDWAVGVPHGGAMAKGVQDQHWADLRRGHIDECNDQIRGGSRYNAGSRHLRRVTGFTAPRPCHGFRIVGRP